MASEPEGFQNITNIQGSAPPNNKAGQTINQAQATQ